MQTAALEKAYKSIKWSRDVVDIKKLEERHFCIKDYMKAEMYKHQRLLKQEEEVQQSQQSLHEKIASQVKHTKTRHQAELDVLIKRITSDKNDQLRLRASDHKKLFSRDKNIMNDLLLKQSTEQRKTIKFLKFALGNRKDISSITHNRQRSLNFESSVWLGSQSRNSAVNNELSIKSLKQSILEQRDHSMIQVKMRNVHQVNNNSRAASHHRKASHA